MAYTNSSMVAYTKLSPNHSGQRTHSIDRITPHCVVGQCTAEGLGDWFAKSSTKASSNYGIDKDGRVGLYVEEKNRSWCSSSNANDQRAVTIECASDTTERDQFYMEDYHEAIISREDFEAVGQLIAQHAKEKNIKKADQKYQNKYPFTGKIFCGCCGSPFKRKVNYTGNLRYPSWVCREHIDHKEHCPMKAIREDDIERAFMTVINKLVFGRKEVLQVLLDSLRSETHKAM